MGQSMKSWQHGHENLSLDPQNPKKKPGTAACVCNPTMWGSKDRQGPRSSLASQSDPSDEPHAQ